MDSRAVAPVVGKVLAAGLAVLYISATTSLVLGGIAPEYRDATGNELGERVLATAAGTVERALPETDASVKAHATADLPATIRNAGYAIEIANGTLYLDHPRDALDCRARIQLPSSVSIAEGRWDSGGALVVSVSGPPTNRTLRLAEGPS
jgi:hypothetical protein